MKRILGIDLGTTFSVAAVLEAGVPVVVPNREGRRRTPSVIAFGPVGQVLIGAAARRQASLDLSRTFPAIKRRLGSRELLSTGQHRLTAEEITALLLAQLREDAERFLGEPVDEAVLTVPAYFNENQRQAARNAGRLAGLTIRRLLPEPVAAALAYGAVRRREGRLLVFDLGGGTFDVSILEVTDGLVEVRATAGVARLGGEDFDERLARELARRFIEKTGLDLLSDPYAAWRLRRESEAAKIRLSDVLATSVEIPFITADERGGRHFAESVRRGDFEALIRPLLATTAAPVRQALRDAGIAAGDLDQVLLVGGSTRIPLVEAWVHELLPGPKVERFAPEECVARGAAIAAGALAGQGPRPLLLDATPQTLGVESDDGRMIALLPRGSVLPARRRKLFSTTHNGQVRVRIHVLQGEHERAGDNTSLGHFVLSGIRSAAAGQPKIEVTFELDLEGALEVSARDLETGRTHDVRLESGSMLDESEIEMRLAAAGRRRLDEREHVLALQREAEARLAEVHERLPRLSRRERPVFEESLRLLESALAGDDLDRLSLSLDDVRFLMEEVAV